ncbi:MAG: hypothetical protein JOZ08_16910 [Verrucomicrobia bacterium]|nr:hypothetical protein [Verrucomicrobiota bacterium]
MSQVFFRLGQQQFASRPLIALHQDTRHHTDTEGTASPEARFRRTSGSSFLPASQSAAGATIGVLSIEPVFRDT